MRPATAGKTAFVTAAGAGIEPRHVEGLRAQGRACRRDRRRRAPPAQTSPAASAALWM